jgi:hypothetical protein
MKLTDYPHHVQERLVHDNPGVFAPLQTAKAMLDAMPGKRIRQSSAPKMNKLESEYFAILSAQFPNYPRPHAQAVRFQLANGVTFTPDIFCFHWPDIEGPATPTAFEVKGRHAWDDAIVKLKVAASAYPEVRWVLVWKPGATWSEQKVLS